MKYKSNSDISDVVNTIEDAMKDVASGVIGVTEIDFSTEKNDNKKEDKDVKCNKKICNIVENQLNTIEISLELISRSIAQLRKALEISNESDD